MNLKPSRRTYQHGLAIGLVMLGIGLSVTATTTAQEKEETSQLSDSKVGKVLGNVKGHVGEARILPAESAVHTTDTIMVKGKPVHYKATAGTQPVWDKDGKVVASVFYTYYQRTDVSNKETRPIFFSFNGGPGSGSVWMHVGYTGPKVLKVDSEGYPIQPYGVRDNPHSILDVADIVFIDPVNTGFSRILDAKVERSLFFGVNADIAYLADWVNTFVGRVGRWHSPKYLIGESYGTTRVSGLARELQSNYWMFLNGVILVSPTKLGGIEREGPVADANTIPYYAATAWYHKVLNADLQKRDLEQLLPEVEAFALNEYLPAIAKGTMLDEESRKNIIKKTAMYTGLSETFITQNNLVVPTNYFWKELLRHRGQTVGRLDSRYKGIDKADAGSNPDYNAELVSWFHSFTPAINAYLRDTLKFKTDLKYITLGSMVQPWDHSNDKTGEHLRFAMAQNPYLHLMIQSGYFDGATNYFDAKYTMWNLDRSGKMKDRMEFRAYRSGHMMYLRSEDLATSNEHIREFIKKSTPKAGQSAAYQ